MSASRREHSERKPMAVLVADGVGYSRPMGEDEDGYLDDTSLASPIGRSARLRRWAR
jgi:hypothetical protein